MGLGYSSKTYITSQADTIKKLMQQTTLTTQARGESRSHSLCAPAPCCKEHVVAWGFLLSTCSQTVWEIRGREKGERVARQGRMNLHATATILSSYVSSWAWLRTPPVVRRFLLRSALCQLGRWGDGSRQRADTKRRKLHAANECHPSWASLSPQLLLAVGFRSSSGVPPAVRPPGESSRRGQVGRGGGKWWVNRQQGVMSDGWGDSQQGGQVSQFIKFPLNFNPNFQSIY